MRSRIALLALVAGGVFASATAQGGGDLSIAAVPAACMPLSGVTDFGLGAQASLELDYRLGAGVSVGAGGGYGLVSSPASSLTLAYGSLVASWGSFISDRLGLGLEVEGGPYSASWEGQSGWSWRLAGGARLDLRITPGLTLSLEPSYSFYMGPGQAFMQSVGLGLGTRLAFKGRGGEAVGISGVDISPVFPVFYGWYDRNPFGKVVVQNREDGSIRDVKVSFVIKQYMNEPKLCASFPVIERDKSVEVPIIALFTEDLLKLTEDTKATAEIVVDYTFLGKKGEARQSSTVKIYHRNALTWDDDRRAAAFVSAKDPAVLRYSKFAAGVIREASAPAEIDKNFRFALGLFEGLDLYGVNYVVDPTTPYAELSSTSTAVDFLQFPYQTLIYKGGDCDDLSIMYSAILESVGIPAAFVTVPGHIYVAFALESDEAKARKDFSNYDDLIVSGGKVWVPVEITVRNGGFLKAWATGAQEWRKAGTEGAFYPLDQAWRLYEPVGIPGEDTRIVLPSPEELAASYVKSLSAFASREVGARVGPLRAQLAAKGGADPKVLNSIGVLYARWGQFPEARVEFEKAAKAGSFQALANLGNVAFLQKDFKAAADYYSRALQTQPGNEVALLGMARSRYELGDYAEAARRFEELGRVAPSLASAYSYLQSGSSGLGRASGAGGNENLAPWDGQGGD